MTKNYPEIIFEIKENSADKNDFCNKLISLDVDDGFDIFMATNTNAAELFELAIRYLDNETVHRDEIWAEIERYVNKLQPKN